MNQDAQVPILSAMFGPCEADVAIFIDELQALQGGLDGALVESVRKAMDDDGFILPFNDHPDAPVLNAVDGSTMVVPLGEVLTVISLAAFRGEPDSSLFSRVTGANAEILGRAASGLRTCIEAELLADAPHVTIADGSFWSILMEGNQFITLMKNAGDDAPSNLVSVYEAAIESPAGCVARALMNTNVVAMSKVATSHALTKPSKTGKTGKKIYGGDYQRFFAHSISDRLLLTKTLRPGEYTRPRQIAKMTDGSFGLEQRGWPGDVRDKLQGPVFGSDNGLHVTFVRPWEEQPAYRVEFHRAGFNDAALHGLFTALRAATTNPMIREPEPQFLADLVCKQASAMAALYGDVHRHRFPDLLAPTRSSDFYGRSA